MRLLFPAVWFIIFLCFCKSNPRKAEAPFNRTSDQSEIFFKNIRSSDYLKKEMPTAGVNIFTHKKWIEEAPFRPLLIHNWREDQAFILLEFNSMSDEMWLVKEDTLTCVSGLSASEQTKTALFIDSMTYSSDILILPDSLPLFFSEKDWEVFHEIINDYRRLIEQ